MRKYVIFAISIILIIVSVVFSSAEGLILNNSFRELTEEEQQQVNDATEVIQEVANFEMPDISSLMSQAKINTSLSSVDDAENLSSISSVTLGFEYKLDIGMDVTYEGESMKATESEYIKGECLLTKDAVLLDYQEGYMTGVINVNLPFKTYISKDAVLVYFYEGASSYLNITTGKWINIYSKDISSSITSQVESSIQSYNDALFGELGYYGDFFKKNSATSFVAMSGKYRLNNSKYSEFAENLSRLNVNNNKALYQGLIKDLDFSYNKMSGSFMLDLSRDDVIKMENNMNWDISASISVSGLSNIKCDYDLSGYVKYEIRDIDNTTITKPTI